MRILRLVPLLLLLVAAAPLRAQEEPRTDVPMAAAVRPEEIPRRAAEALARVEEIRERARERGGVDALARRTRILRARADSLASSADLRDPARAEALHLQETLAAGEATRGELRSVSAALEERARDLGGFATELAGRNATWAATGDSADAWSLPGDLRTRVDGIREAIGGAREEVLAGRDRVLSLADSVTASLLPLERAVEVGRRTLGTRSLERATSRTAPPLWRVRELAADTTATGLEWDTLRTRSRIGLGYLQSQPGRVTLQVLFGLLLFLVALRARGRMEQLGLEGTRESRMLRHPLAAAVLFSTVLTPVFHPSAPVILYEQTDGLVLVALLFLARALFPAGIRRWALGTLALFLVFRITDLILSGGIAERLVRLVLEVVLGVGLGLLLPRWPRLVPRERGWAALRFLLGAGLLLSALAVGANAAGNVGFDHLLLAGLLNNTFTGMVLLAAGVLFRMFLRVGLWSPGLGTLHSVRAHRELIEIRIVGVVHILLWVSWVLLLVLDFGLWPHFRAAIQQALDASFSLGTVTLSVGGILGFFLALWLTVKASTLLRFVLGKEILPRFRLERGVPEAIATLSNYVLLVVGFILALAVLGVELSRLTLLVSALGVGIGFGLQNVVNNFVSGLILTFERPVQVGDTVQSGTYQGRISRIGVRSSTIRTWDGAEVIVPNGDLISKEVINWTLSDQLRRLELRVGVAYGSDPEAVIGILEGTVRDREGILADPPPAGLFVGFGDSSLDFLLRYWVRGNDDWVRFHSDTHLAVYRALAEAGITIPFPQRDLHIIDPRRDGPVGD